MHQINDYYTLYNVRRTDTPLLSNVCATFILTLEDSTREITDDFLLNLTPQTFKFVNKGFKKCKKPYNINESNRDINYSMYTLFNYVNKNTNFKNILVLEDDAKVLNYDTFHYEKVNNYINENDYNIFSFGSFGIFLSKNNYIYDIINPRASQACIYSINSRYNLNKHFLKNNFNGHLDADYIYNVKTYKLPLITQTFPKTINNDQWSYFDKILFNFINKILCIKLSEDIDGWNAMYKFCSNILITIIYAFIVILIFIILKCSYL